MKKQLLLSLILALFCLPSTAQIVYGLQYDGGYNPIDPADDFNLLTINPFMASPDTAMPILNTMGVSLSSSAFDHANNRYVFWGIDDQYQERFYVMDVLTGQLLYSPLVVGRGPNELQYDLQYSTPYGLQWDDTNNVEYFVTVDLTTGVSSPIAILPGVQYINPGTSSFDSNNGRYFFVGADGQFNVNYYTVSAASGQILHSIPLPSDYSSLLRDPKYDATDNRLYCMWNVVDSTIAPDPILNQPYRNTYFAEVDTLTGQATILNQTPLMSGFQAVYMPGSTEFDQQTQTYIYVGKEDNDPEFRLFVIDAPTATLISSTPFPAGNPIIELEIDNQNFANKTYNLNTGLAERLFAGELELSPNPAQEQLNLKLSLEQSGEYQIEIRDIFGKLISQQREAFGAGENEISLSIHKLAAGLYTCQIIDPKQGMTTERFVKR
ncbi:MAG: T9SS type A sorting domain-containing protein [Bacteroidota bacterium]